MFRSLIIVCCLFFSLTLRSQTERKISGIVKTISDNTALPGASIRIKGTRKGTLSDFNGRFVYSLKASNINSIILEVSFLGFKTAFIPVGNTSFFEISLEENTNSLDEIVITSSYGTTKLKEELVGSITTIKAKEIITEQVVSSFDELLEGQAAGVYIETNNQLGEETKINIRGQGSLTPLNNNAIGTSNQPLIIIDGIILSEETGIDGSDFFDNGGGNFSENILNPLARVGIQDIESFNILKDAAAVGLYGADAANGVIIITTKSGNKGPLKFEASIQSGISTPFNEFKYLSGEQYQTVNNIYHTNSGNFSSVAPWNGVNTDWHNLLNRIGTYSNYNFGLSGGTNFWKYRANFGYQQNNETQLNNSFNRLNTSFAIDYKNKKLNASLRVSPSLVIKDTPNTLYNFAVDPTEAPFDENGKFTNFPTFGNPLAVANQNINNVETKAVLASFSLNYKLLDNLKVSSLLGMDFSEKEEDRFFSGDNGSGIFNDGTLGRRIRRDRNTNKWNWNANIVYNTIFGENHNFDALIGVEARKESAKLSYARGNGFSNFSTPQPITEATEQDYERDSNQNTGRSLFSQLNYNFDKKYFFLLNLRVDQSSAFGRDKNTAFNGGAGASWLLSNESFFNSEKINSLKLRASYGSTGNSRIGAYRALGLYTVDNQGNGGYNGFNYANPSSPPNPNLGWERNLKFNLGLDITFLNKFNATIEVFKDTRKDIITSRDALPEIGFSNVQINGSEMYNQGIEFSIQSNWIQNEKFNWSTNFNITCLENKVTSLSGLGSQFSGAENARAQRIGFPTSTIWGHNFIGIDPATGRELFDVKGEIFDSSYIAQNLESEDWVPIGNSQPEVFGGLRNSFNYKGFNLSFVFSYAFGLDNLLDRNLVDNYRILTNRNINANIFYDAWQQQGDQALYPIIADNNRIISNSSKYLVDGSNIKLRAINFSYRLPTDKFRIPVKNLTLFANVSNVYTWYTSASKSNRNGIAEFNNIYPEMRTFSLGLKTRF